MPPSRLQTGTPGFVGFTHFHSSSIVGSAARMRRRRCSSVSPRQPPSSFVRFVILLDADSSFGSLLGTLFLLTTIAEWFVRPHYGPNDLRIVSSTLTSLPQSKARS